MFMAELFMTAPKCKQPNVLQQMKGTHRGTQAALKKE